MGFRDRNRSFAHVLFVLDSGGEVTMQKQLTEPFSNQQELYKHIHFQAKRVIPHCTQYLNTVLIDLRSNYSTILHSAKLHSIEGSANMIINNSISLYIFSRSLMNTPILFQLSIRYLPISAITNAVTTSFKTKRFGTILHVFSHYMFWQAGHISLIGHIQDLLHQVLITYHKELYISNQTSPAIPHSSVVQPNILDEAQYFILVTTKAW